MKNNLKIVLPFVVAVSLLMIFESVKPKPVDWSLSFSLTDKIPFGSYALFNLLDNVFTNGPVKIADKPLYNQLAGIDSSSINYLVFNNSFDPDKLDIQQLLNFVEGGGNILIAAGMFGDAFKDS